MTQEATVWTDPVTGDRFRMVEQVRHASGICDGCAFECFTADPHNCRRCQDSPPCGGPVWHIFAPAE